jgi:acyl dehydratase
MTSGIDRALIGREFDRTTFPPVTAEQIRAYAAAYGDLDPRWSAPDADVLAPPTFVLSLRPDGGLPAHLPRRAEHTALDASKDIELGAPIRPGDRLTVTSTLRDIYEKTGRSGRMTFMVLRTTVVNQRGEMVAVIDQRVMVR